MRSKLPAEFQVSATFAAGTGMRKGECFGLVVDRLYLPHKPGDRSGTVKVDQQLDQANPLTFGPLKTRASYRTIPTPFDVRLSLECSGTSREAAATERSALATALLRQLAHPVRRVRQDGVGPVRPCFCCGRWIPIRTCGLIQTTGPGMRLIQCSGRSPQTAGRDTADYNLNSLYVAANALGHKGEVWDLAG